MRKAADLGATVAEEYVDRGESARSADRPDLNRMLVELAQQPVELRDRGLPLGWLTSQA